MYTKMEKCVGWLGQNVQTGSWVNEWSEYELLAVMVNSVGWETYRPQAGLREIEEWLQGRLSGEMSRWNSGKEGKVGSLQFLGGSFLRELVAVKKTIGFCHGFHGNCR